MFLTGIKQIDGALAGAIANVLALDAQNPPEQDPRRRAAALELLEAVDAVEAHFEGERRSRGRNPREPWDPPHWLKSDERARCVAARERLLSPIKAADADTRDLVISINNLIREAHPNWCCDDVLNSDEPIVAALSLYLAALTDRDCWMLQYQTQIPGLAASEPTDSLAANMPGYLWGLAHGHPGELEAAVEMWSAENNEVGIKQLADVAGHLHQLASAALDAVARQPRLAPIGDRAARA